MIQKDDAVYAAYCEIVPYTSNPVGVQVEEGEDEFGLFVRVYWNEKQSSKIRYEKMD